MADLKYTLAQMQQALADANARTNAYSEAITTLDSSIKKLGNDWISTEVGTYEAFLEKYNAKRQSLFDARDYMIEFCKKLAERIETFNGTASEIKNSFN